MTVNNDLIRVGGPIARGGVADLILPEYVMPTLMNTTIPTEADLYTQSEIQLYPLGTKRTTLAATAKPAEQLPQLVSAKATTYRFRAKLETA
jgi:hypothetical protein